jgi:uncharacterized protein (DUF305 family)
MRNSSHRFAALALAAIAAAAAPAAAQQEQRTVRPGAPGAPSQALTPAQAAEGQPVYTEADVRFMQGMIPHHAQALEMTALVEGRTERTDIQLLARRIERAQTDEIAMMRHWLEERGERVPDEHAQHSRRGQHGAEAHQGHPSAPAAAHAGMPGMLTPEAMARLAAVSGAEFDRLFLEAMIRHHEGALVMVAELFASEGGGQEGEMFQIASHIDGDQRIEIARMYRILGAGR